VTLRHVTAQRGASSPFDVGFQSVAGYCLARTRSPLRLSTPDSVPTRGRGCNAGLDLFALATAPAAQTGAAGSAVSYTVRTIATSGRPDPVTLAATGLPSGAQATFSRNPVRPGQLATLTVTIPPGTRNATYPITVVGTGTTATQYARANLTVTGGVDLAITDVTVNDPDHAAGWSVQADLRPGVLLFPDRTFTVASVPNDYVGARWIRTANDSRTATADPLATFTLTAPATVVVAVDTRLGRPVWLDPSWVDTGNQLNDWEGGTTFRRFQAFAKPFPAGPVSLGPAAVGTRAGNMYTVIVV